MNEPRAAAVRIELYWRLFRIALGLLIVYFASTGLFSLGVHEVVRAARPHLAESWTRGSELFACAVLFPPILAAAMTASVHRSTPGAMVDGLAPVVGCLCIWGPQAYICSEVVAPGAGMRLVVPCMFVAVAGSVLAARTAALRGLGR